MNSKTVQEKALRWWCSMVQSRDELEKQGIRPAPTRYRAELKRCAAVDDIVLTEGFRALWFSVADAQEPDADLDVECLAVIAGVLAYVAVNGGSSVGGAAGKVDKDKSSGKPLVSEQRFYKLLHVRSPNDLLRQLRRLAQQLGHTLPVEAVAADIVKWFDEKRRLRPGRTDQRVVVRWATDYFRAAAAAKK
ncbi:type I-E CRISPR-associated protein Cse2/CasB [Alcaligenes sp. SDU_A2]|uniref:type I-E CRISPR-associated protein Cse2/CasB n=1 Tax=Alcaligenes sp. SDU_A2 TaxID=3136634 RepID=UPI00311DFAB9